MLRLYGFKFSQPTRSVMLLLEKNKIPYSFEVCDVFKGDNRKPAYLKIAPTGLVPAIQEDDGFTLSEVSAIMTYLAESRGLNEWFGKKEDFKARGRVNFWLSWHHFNSRTSTRDILTSALFPKLPTSEGKFKAGQGTMKKAMKFMDNSLSSSSFLASNTSHPSIADLIILPEVDQLLPEAFNLFDYDEFPHVLRWVKDMNSFLGEEVYGNNFNPVKEAAKSRQLKRLA